MGVAGETRTPPMEASDEATHGQLGLARDQGRTMLQALREMTHGEATSGVSRRAGDYLVAVAVEHAEGLWRMRGGALRWEEPEDENAHLEVAVCDGGDGRFVPGLHVTVTLTAPDGSVVGTHVHPFLWHPWLYHYGRNWRVPADGEYAVKVRIDAPDFPRHDPVNGRRYAEPVEVEFTGVRIETGRKTTGG